MTRFACDTSVVVPALLPWHADHVSTRKALRTVSGIPAHVLVETFSVLTRLPAPHRLSPIDAGAALDGLQQVGLQVLTLPAQDYHPLIGLLAAAGLSGGVVYDAVIGATARANDYVLWTRDRRARVTYERVGVEYRLL